MALQGFTVLILGIGIASLLYHMFVSSDNHGRQRYESGNGPNVETYSNFANWMDTPNNHSVRNGHRRRRRSRTYSRNDQCTICLAAIINHKEELPCSHCFHKDCIKDWKVQGPEGSRNTCPLCRTRITSGING